MEKDIFSTRDLALAATLLTLRFYHIRCDFSLEGEKNNAVGYFIFESTPELRDAELKYRRGLITVEPKAFMSNIHQLKAEVMNYLKSPHTTH